MQENKFEKTSIIIEEIIPNEVFDLSFLMNKWQEYIPFIIGGIWTDNNDKIQSLLEQYCEKCNIEKMTISVQMLDKKIKSFEYNKYK